ncbi:hypothetical protein BDN72DRAFT_864062 [Pluteus cervinus]|uniref:Uncharacterized protein n=1 Tax=Pluteus cervinus TaxID=181527 RepID=A0ACD3A4S5_9AGAR|nr:hypothetical protein BDN72DRAFT_864062 [Pluteus cervinus]
MILVWTVLNIVHSIIFLISAVSIIPVISIVDAFSIVSIVGPVISILRLRLVTSTTKGFLYAQSYFCPAIHRPYAIICVLSISPAGCWTKPRIENCLKLIFDWHHVIRGVKVVECAIFDGHLQRLELVGEKSEPAQKRQDVREGQVFEKRQFHQDEQDVLPINSCSRAGGERAKPPVTFAISKVKLLQMLKIAIKENIWDFDIAKFQVLQDQASSVQIFRQYRRGIVGSSPAWAINESQNFRIAVESQMKGEGGWAIPALGEEDHSVTYVTSSPPSSIGRVTEHTRRFFLTHRVSLWRLSFFMLSSMGDVRRGVLLYLRQQLTFHPSPLGFVASCRQWREEIRSTPALWSVIGAPTWYSYHKNLVKFVLQDIIGNFSIPLRIQLGFRSQSDILALVLEGFSNRIVSLGYGPLTAKNDNSSRVLANKLVNTGPFLQELQLHEVEVPSSLFDGAFPSLKILSLNTCIFHWKIVSLTTLKELAIYHPNKRIDWQHVLLILVQLPLLESFRLSDTLPLFEDEFSTSIPASLAGVNLPFNPPSLSNFELFEFEPASVVYLLHKLSFRHNQLKELDVHIKFQPGSSDYEDDEAAWSIRRLKQILERWWGKPANVICPTERHNYWRCAFGETKVKFCVDDPYSASEVD